MPDIEGLILFAKVAEEHSFAGAARALGVSVATVSRGVGRLEARLGARLLNRSSRRIALTAFGQTLAARASQLYADAVEAERSGREAASHPRGLVRLAVPMAFGLRWIAPILPDFFRTYPDISIDLHLSDDRVDIVGDGFDAALRIATTLDTSLSARRLCPVTRHVVASPDYLARRGHPSHPRDLLEHDCLTYAYNARKDIWRFTDATGAVLDVAPRGPLRVTNSDVLIPMVLEGLGIAEFPSFMTGEYLRDGRMQAILPGWSLPGGALYFVTPTARSRPAKVEALAAFLVSRLARLNWT